jgi:alanyl-tRNA synthetase
VGYADLDQAIGRLQAEAEDTRKRLAEAQHKLTEIELVELEANAQKRGGLALIAAAWADRDAVTLRTLAKKLASKEKTIVLLGSAGRQPMFVFARSADLALDLVPLVRAAIERIGGKGGGGKPDFCQGGGPPASEVEVRAAIQSICDQLSVAR